MNKLLPVFLTLVGIGSGVGAGIFLKPAAKDATPDSIDCVVAPNTPAPSLPGAAQSGGQGGSRNHEYVKMNNQFVVPIISQEKVTSLVALSLSIEVVRGSTGTIYQFEPRLRDSFLQVLFDHANIGGFRGAFTETGNMAVLRRALLETAQNTLGDIVTDVLITEIARQDS